MPGTHPNRRSSPFLLAILLTSAACQPSSGQILINEFLYRDVDARLEFVEILNHTSAAVDLSMLAISDSRRAYVPTTERPRLLDPEAFAVLVRDSVAFDVRFDAERIQVPAWPALNNGGDALILWSNGQPIDSVFFDGSWGDYGRSVERVDPDAPSTIGTNWRASIDPSGATPGSRNSVFNPDDSPPEVLEVEEWTDGSVVVYANEPLDPNTLSSAHFRFAAGDRPRGSRLSTDRKRIILEPWWGADLSVLTIDGLSDAAGNQSGTISKSVARQPGASEVILNELLFEPLSDPFDGLPDQYEFVEIRSLANHPIAMRGFALTGRPDESGSGDTLRFDDRPLRLRGRGYGVLFAAGSDPDLFPTAFPSLPPDSQAVRAPIHRASLSLDNSGDTVRLLSAGGEVLDEVSYSASWHRPERVVTRGVSLERIAAEAPSNDASSWTSSVDPEGATPGRENSVAVGVERATAEALTVQPSPFSPDADGWEDFTMITVRTDRPSTSIAVWIYDEAGRLVRSLTEAFPVGPESSFAWDGRDDAGRMLGTGIFVVYVEAVDTSVGDVRYFKRPVVIAQSF